MVFDLRYNLLLGCLAAGSWGIAADVAQLALVDVCVAASCRLGVLVQHGCPTHLEASTSVIREQRLLSIVSQISIMSLLRLL